ncbi:hypothetical protein HDF26_003449 [Pedobacter cryoconitis]|nr:hypothetical protein [Pedobacter cryoconitis]
MLYFCGNKKSFSFLMISLYVITKGLGFLSDNFDVVFDD